MRMRVLSLPLCWRVAAAGVRRRRQPPVTSSPSPSMTWSPPPIRWRRKRDWRCCAPAAARWMPPSPRRWCWAWSSRNPPASAAAPSCWSMIPRPSRPPASTAAKWRRPPPRPTMFLDADGKPRGPSRRHSRRLSVGIPGVVGMLEMAHQKYGKLPWARLFQPAIKLADDGFPVGPKLARTIKSFTPRRQHARHRAHFYHRRRHAAGGRRDLQESRICRGSLRLIAAGGSEGFLYRRDRPGDRRRGAACARSIRAA